MAEARQQDKPRPSLIDRFRNMTTGGALDAMKKAAQPTAKPSPTADKTNPSTKPSHIRMREQNMKKASPFGKKMKYAYQPNKSLFSMKKGPTQGKKLPKN